MSSTLSILLDPDPGRKVHQQTIPLGCSGSKPVEVWLACLSFKSEPSRSPVPFKRVYAAWLFGSRIADEEGRRSVLPQVAAAWGIASPSFNRYVSRGKNWPGLLLSGARSRTRDEDSKKVCDTRSLPSQLRSRNSTSTPHRFVINLSSLIIFNAYQRCRRLSENTLQPPYANGPTPCCPHH